MNPLQGLYTFPRGMDMAPYKENFEVYNEKRNMNVQNWYTTITDLSKILIGWSTVRKTRTNVPCVGVGFR